MESKSSAIEQFFRAYERNSATGDVAAIVAQFADVFMAAGPAGARAVKASDFALAIPGRIALFASLGCKSTELVSLEEVECDERFAMVKTQWRMRFDRGPEGEKQAVADSIFMVDTGAEAFKIVLYLAKEDHMEMLRRHGVLAGEK